MRPPTRGRPAGDEGTVLLLIVAYFLVAAMLVIVVVDSAAVFLARRQLANLADGAALAGAQAVDQSRVYGNALGPDLPLSTAGVQAAVASYLADRSSDYPGLSVQAAGTDGVTVTVSLADRPRLPLLGPLAAAVPGGAVRVAATASARSPLR